MFAQNIKHGFTFLTNYSNYLHQTSIQNIEQFDISDYKEFGIGLEKMEGRMRFYEIDVEEYYLAIQNFSFFSYIYERNKLVFTIGVIFKNYLSAGYNIYENNHFFITTSLGFCSMKNGKVIGKLTYLENFQFPIYNFVNNYPVNLKSTKRNIYTDFRANYKLKLFNAAKKDGFIIFASIQPAYTYEISKLNFSDNVTVLYTDTYNQFPTKYKKNYFSIMYSFGIYLARWD